MSGELCLLFSDCSFGNSRLSGAITLYAAYQIHVWNEERFAFAAGSYSEDVRWVLDAVHVPGCLLWKPHIVR